MALALRYSARSDVGLLREINEDSGYAGPRLLVIADGVGGHAAGEVASRWIIQVLAQLDNCRLVKPLDAALADAVAWGNQTIGFISECRPESAGMSTTLTAVALGNDGAYVLANIGDSRTYLLRDGRLSRLTRDDSFIQELVDRGELTPEQARRHPARNVVMEALDGRPERRAATEILAARPGDRLLLCSDGLSDALDDHALAELLRAHADREACTRALVAAALAAGGRDNVSAVVADVVPGPGVAWLPAL
jgi:serine/threonine protein phosphatase PrpC